MDLNWTNYKDSGNPEFGRSGNTFTIKRDVGERGRWFAVWPEKVAPGDRIPFKAEISETGYLIATFWIDRIASGTFKGSEKFGDGVLDSAVVVPAGADWNIVRFELRGWEGIDQTTVDEFANVLIGEEDTPVLDAPSLAVVDYDEEEKIISVYWNIVQGAERYDLHEQAVDVSENWILVYSGSDTVAFLSGRAAGKYCYRARAFASEGTKKIVSEWSNILCTTVPEPVELTPPIFHDIINEDYSNEYSLEWNAIEGAEEYQILEAFGSGDWLEVYRGPDTSIDFVKSDEGSYCYHGRSLRGEQKSDWGNVVCVQVGEPEPQKMMHVYHLATPDLTHLWTVTISDSGFAANVKDMPDEDEEVAKAQALINEMSATDPGYPPELVDPEFGEIHPGFD